MKEGKRMKAREEISEKMPAIVPGMVLEIAAPSQEFELVVGWQHDGTYITYELRPGDSEDCVELGDLHLFSADFLDGVLVRIYADNSDEESQYKPLWLDRLYSVITGAGRSIFCVWEAPLEVTMDEVCRKFGRRVKIVEGR